MKIDFDAVLKTLDGEEIKNGDKTVMLKTVAVESLLNPNGKEQPEPMVKVERFKLAQKIHDGGEIDLQSEDIAMIKKLIGESYAPLIVGQAYEMLESG